MRASTLFVCGLLAAGCAPIAGEDHDEGGGTGGGGAGGASSADGPAVLASSLCASGADCDVDEICDPGTLACRAATPCSPSGLGDAHCGHCDDGTCGFPAGYAARCDPERSICTRVLGLCEPCTSDAECQDPGDVPGRFVCAAFADGERACTTVHTCTPGFQRDADDVCRPPAGCNGRSACADDDACDPERTGLRCARIGDVPGACIELCRSDLDCPPLAGEARICNTDRGLCAPACTTTGCILDEACQPNGHCGPACAADSDCTGGLICNLPGEPDYKPSLDDFACVPNGCVSNADCLPQTLCDTNDGRCVPGCEGDGDCYYGEACEAGACIDPGCRNKILDCDLNEFCCGEAPYADPAACPAGVERGNCFAAPEPPWCVPCFFDSECGDGNLCVPFGGGSTCGVACESTAECPRGWSCRDLRQGCRSNGDCGAGGCQGNDDGDLGTCACTTDADCTGGAECAQGSCRLARNCVFGLCGEY